MPPPGTRTARPPGSASVTNPGTVELVPDPALGQLGVPGAFRGSFEAVEQLDDEPASKLVKGFEAVASFQQVADLQRTTQNVFLRNGKRTQNDSSLHFFRCSLGNFARDAVERIAEAVSQSADLELDESARSRLCERLLPLLGSKALSSTADRC